MFHISIRSERNLFIQFTKATIHHSQGFFECNGEYTSTIFLQTVHRKSRTDSFKFKTVLMLCSVRFFKIAPNSHICGEHFILKAILVSAATNFFKISSNRKNPISSIKRICIKIPVNYSTAMA